ncbi:MAG: L-threonylcarbamoyladenylate synthase [Actinomycetaceae bacterium]|nr:L-threonylcarbamoyladenylate synthase [Actinomycetaceae bacterium]
MRLDCPESFPAHRAEEISRALALGRAIVIPTDTIYGIGADPYSTRAVNDLLALKGRGRHMPPPVLVSSMEEAETVSTHLTEAARALMRHFWPGALTLIVRANPRINFDLGDIKDTLAIRMPDHAVALSVLRETGPLAVTSANLTGQPPATSYQEAKAYFGQSVAYYIDSGPTPGPVPSTIVDTVDVPRVVRRGAISVEEIEQVLVTV